MKHICSWLLAVLQRSLPLLTLGTLIIVTCAITILSIQYDWSNLTYFMTCLGTGAILGFVSGQLGYES